jgi:hypothetical protein
MTHKTSHLYIVNLQFIQSALHFYQAILRLLLLPALIYLNVSRQTKPHTPIPEQQQWVSVSPFHGAGATQPWAWEVWVAWAWAWAWACHLLVDITEVEWEEWVAWELAGMGAMGDMGDGVALRGALGMGDDLVEAGDAERWVSSFSVIHLS